VKRLVLAVLILGLFAPQARADGLLTLQKLAKRHLRPAPLVPTSAPRPLSNLNATLETAPGRKGGYAVRLAHYTDYGPDAIIVLSRDDYRSLRAALRDYRRAGFTVGRTRIRGRRASRLTRNGSTVLLWKEGGRIFSIATGTPRKVTVKGLRATAAGLEPLGANYLGQYFAPGSNNTFFDATLVTTQHHVSGLVEWGTDNCTFNGEPAAAYAGQASFMMLPLSSGAFSIPLDGPLVTPKGWNGSISGVVSTSAINLTMQGSGVFDDESCDTGPMAVTAEQRDPN
jgi:hypothetical protein